MTDVTYFYSAHSAFAYLGHRHLRTLCASHGATLVHKPFELSPVVEAQGSRPFAERTQAHVDYFFGREIERWAEWRGLPVLSYRPSFHDADYGLAGRLIIALGNQGAEVDALAEAILSAHWVEDVDLSDIGALRAILARCGLDAPALLARAETEEVGTTYDANTAEALRLGVMGSPTYVIGGDLFYGQDRLDMVARALEVPFQPTQWRNPPVDGSRDG